jgi:hypothetical protein
MPGMDIKSALRYMVIMTGICISLLILVELTGWLFVPDRYRDPPAVTADAWIHSDALTEKDTVWMREFVDEFLRSYTARWTSYLYFRREPFSGMHINVDSSGQRITPQFAVGTGDAWRSPTVVLLGGSTMWGTAARDSGTIPAALARLMATKSDQPVMRVVNMGESGYVNTQSLLALELELRRGNVPDNVIFYDGVNDIFSAYQNNLAGLPQNEQHRELEFNLLLDGERMRELGLNDFWKRTVTAGVVASLRNKISKSPPAPPLRDHLAAEVIRIYRGNLKILDALSRLFGFHYRVYWQPVVFSRRDPSPYEQTQMDKMEHVRSFYNEVYRLVAADSTLRANPHFHNLSDVFDGVGPIYLDFCHISERGNEIIAKHMYEDIFKPAAPVH